jgi:hypothetical protein
VRQSEGAQRLNDVVAVFVIHVFVRGFETSGAGKEVAKNALGGS